MVVSAIVLNGWNDQMPQLIYPGASKSATANYYMFNTVTKQGFEDTMAIMSFLAERYSGAISTMAAYPTGSSETRSTTTSSGTTPAPWPLRSM